MLSEDTSGIAKAVAMAKAADTVVLAMGSDLTWRYIWIPPAAVCGFLKQSLMVTPQVR